MYFVPLRMPKVKTIATTRCTGVQHYSLVQLKHILVYNYVITNFPSFESSFVFKSGIIAVCFIFNWFLRFYQFLSCNDVWLFRSIKWPSKLMLTILKSFFIMNGLLLLLHTLNDRDYERAGYRRSIMIATKGNLNAKLSNTLILVYMNVCLGFMFFLRGLPFVSVFRNFLNLFSDSNNHKCPFQPLQTRCDRKSE